MTMPKGWKPPKRTGGRDHQSLPPDSSSRKQHVNSRQSIIAIVIIGILIILVMSFVLNPYLLILIPAMLLGLVRAIKKTGMDRYYDNMSKRGNRRNQHQDYSATNCLQIERQTRIRLRHSTEFTTVIVSPSLYTIFQKRNETKLAVL